jgi:toxin-antitoxin system PIN domain toxin
MIIPDINLLLYAYDSNAVAHTAARRWWEALLSGEETVGLLHVVIFGFIRISTNPRAFQHPIAVAEAIGHVRQWLARPMVEVLESGPADVDPVLRSIERLGVAGNLVTDAQIAAAALIHDARVHSADADLRRFPEIRVVNPLTGRQRSRRHRGRR